MTTTVTERYPSGQSVYQIPFDYLARPFVVVTLVDTSVTPERTQLLRVVNDYKFNTATEVEILADQTGFDILQINRFTSSEPMVTFADGSVLTANDLTVAELQAIHIAEEGRDLIDSYVRPAVEAIEDGIEIVKEYRDETKQIYDDTVAAIGNAGDASTLVRLAQDDGSNLVGYRFKGLTAAVKRSVQEKLQDTISVMDFGAKGNWNTQTQTGANDTAAVEATLTYLATMGSRRQAGKQRLYFPAGQYRLDYMNLPSGLQFGVDICGDGWMSTGLRFPKDPVDPTQPAIRIDIEFVNFSDIMFFGSLTESDPAVTANWRPLGIQAKLVDNRPDIDIIFTNCAFQYFQSFIKSYGRSVVFNNGMAGLMGTLCTVVADTSTVFNPTANPRANSQFTGLRHYTFRGLRTDNVSVLFKVEGTATSRDYINDVLITGNDFFFMDKLIDAADGTIRRANVVGNNAIESFATGAIQVKGILHSNVSDNNFSKGYDDYNTFANPMLSLCIATGNMTGCTFRNNHVRGLRGSLVKAGAGAFVTVEGNTLLNAWDLPAQTEHYLFECPGNVPNLRVRNNTVWNVVDSGRHNLFTANQTDLKTICDNNSFNRTWTIDSVGYTPVMSGASGTWVTKAVCKRDGNWMDVEFMVAGTGVTTATGNVVMTLPTPAQAISSDITSTHAGGGPIDYISGFRMTGAVPHSVRVNPSNQTVEFYRSTDLVLTNLTWANRDVANVTIFGRFRYKCA